MLKPAFTALIISILCTPILIVISRKKGFYASVNHRSSHDASIPNTGGIILCFAVLIPLILFSDYPGQEDFSLLVSAFSVLLITGVIDDFNPIPVAYKFLGQFIPAIVIVTSFNEQDLVIPFANNLIQLPYIFHYLFWIFFIVMTINAFNLIDGIDGLAIGLGIIGGLFYLLNFQILGDGNLTIFALSLITGLAGLLLYNMSSRFKIFIGDTGSLLIGGFLVFFALNYISLSGEEAKNSSFFMVAASIFIPVADMVRVTLVRLIHGNSPFQADRQHVHHILLNLLKGNHKLTTGALLVGQLVVLVLFYQAHNLGSMALLSIMAATFMVYVGGVTLLGRLGKT